MNIEQMVGKKFLYNGENKCFNGKMVEVVSSHEKDEELVVICGAETTKVFGAVKVSDLLIKSDFK